MVSLCVVKCDHGLVDEWTEVAWLESDGAAVQAQLERALASFLSQHGISRDSVADNDVRLDLVYLGPTKGRCAKRLMIRNDLLAR
jgi:hypothetical protein